jgi:hypothetical protein
MPASKTHVDSGTLQLKETQAQNEYPGASSALLKAGPKGMGDDDRRATKAAIAGPRAPASLSRGAEAATSNAQADETTAASIFW